MTGNFSDGKVVTQTLKEAPADFRELLPTLLSPQPGGSTFLDAIGAICRNSGVKGLVFPSSRLDSNIEYVRSEGIKTFSGWNFVDYSGDSPYVAPKVLLELLGLQVQWLQPYEVGIQIEWEEDSERRAWKLSVQKKGERQRYGLEWQIMAGQKRLSPSWNLGLPQGSKILNTTAPYWPWRKATQDKRPRWRKASALCPLFRRLCRHTQPILNIFLTALVQLKFFY